MQREFDFVSRLNTDEVAYIIEKKKEQAAMMIQRNFRRHKAQTDRQKMKEQLKANAGLTSDEKELLSAYIPAAELEKRKEDLKKHRDRAEDKFGAPMRFYDAPMTEERRKELKDQVA